MDTSTADNLQQQEDELLVLKVTYADDFIETPPPKVWKGAARLPEFAIRVRHPGSNKIFFTLNIKFPKTYPSRVAPIFNVGQPIAGLDPAQITKLINLINTEAQHHIGDVSVYTIIGEASSWLINNVPTTSKEDGGISLALQMQKRAEEEERALKKREELEAKEREERQMRHDSEFMSQLESDARRKNELARQEHERRRARKRALSDATEKPALEASTISFRNEIVIGPARFEFVRLYHGRKECLGVTYAAEPVCESADCPIQLELHVVTFTTKSYNEQQGRKKLRQLEGEIQTLIKIKSKNLLQIFAVQLSIPTADTNDHTRLNILMEKKPSLNLEELLRDCERIREERALDYIGQILRGLQAIHTTGLYHRYLKPCSIGLADETGGGKTVKIVKLMKAVFYAKLHDMHRSEPFTDSVKGDDHGDPLPDDWLLQETIDSPLTYTRARDMHALGVTVLQMFLGLDVANRLPDPQTALDACSLSPQMTQLVKDFLNPKKKGVNFLTLFSRLRDLSLQHPPKSQPIPFDVMRTPRPEFSPESPELGYFKMPPSRTRKASRWREDWEVLEELGKGAFGSVMKAKNKIDNRIYAVKKIKLNTSTTQNDTRIFREIDALSRLSHRFIVRYYTTWIEEVETLSGSSSNASSDYGEDTEVETETEGTVQLSDDDSFNPFNPLSYDMNELIVDTRRQGSSFPSIRFTNGDVTPADEDEESDGSSMGLSKLMEQASSRGSSSQGISINGSLTPPPRLLRVMYIQMEYVERLTLQEKINEGITEEEAWRLFQQLVDALVHMASLGILHRDIKPTNIFIDSNGDCKVGDFGLATQSLVAVDSSDILHPTSLIKHPDMTNNVGTTFYIAPEVLVRRGGFKDHSKADIFSLGIVFFEMNHKMNTGAERIDVLQKLRLPDIIFPDDWDPKRTQQKQLLKWMLQHNPNERPSALQLSQSPLLPPRIEDEYFKEALQMMTKPDSPHYQAVITALMSQQPRPTRGFLYDEDVPEASSLRRGVIERLGELFRLHGAREVDTPLLMPLTKALSDDQKRVLLLDSRGEVVTLASNALVPLARLAARTKTTRIKRYHIGDTFREGPALGHPVTLPAAVFDIITPDIVHGPQVASAEIISMVHKCLALFPNLSNNYEVIVSHSNISEFIMERFTKEQRISVTDIVTQGKPSMSQKRAMLAKAGISKVAIDEIELLYDVYEEWELIPFRLKKQFPSLYDTFLPYLIEIKKVMELATLCGVTSQLLIRPLMLGKRHELYKNGICFEVVRRSKRSDILATGGRYDHLINQFYPPLVKKDPFCAFGVVVGIERITSSIAAFQSSFMLSHREQKSYGYWSARRCDVYIVSFTPGHYAERLEVASLLWQNGISADLMYETAVQEKNFETITELCSEEGILFTLYPKLKAAKREVTDFKVRSVLRGAEYELSRQDLVPWLQQQIAEQRKADLSTSGVDKDMEVNLMPSTSIGINNIIQDVSVVLPGEGGMKKQRKQTVKLFQDRAYETKLRIKNAMHSGGMPMIALDMPPAAFDSISRNNQWVTDDDVWRTTIAGFFAQQTVYANQIRETVLRKKEEGAEYVLLFSVKEERVALLSLT